MNGKKNVLIADDDPNARKLIVFSIQSPEIEIIAAANGKEALEMATQQRIDLAILDALMPGMHGFELSRRLRELDTCSEVKIFILTSIYKQPQYQMEARMKYGVDDYLLKPFQPDDLKRRVRSVLGLS